MRSVYSPRSAWRTKKGTPQHTHWSINLKRFKHKNINAKIFSAPENLYLFYTQKVYARERGGKPYIVAHKFWYAPQDSIRRCCTFIYTIKIWAQKLLKPIENRRLVRPNGAAYRAPRRIAMESFINADHCGDFITRHSTLNGLTPLPPT